MNYDIQINTLWVLVGAALIFFMQAGFAMVETGFTRAKNAGNIVMKNLMDFAGGSLAFYIIGYGLMFNITGGGFLGKFDLFIIGNYDTGGMPIWAHVVFNTMFCATAATIVSGAMAERTQFKSYLIYSIVISGFVYPIAASWSWGGGWLSTLTIGKATGFVDFAGSVLVHMVGGIAALVGAKILGPRIGKYNKKGKPRAIPGHSITLGALGVFILWFGWFGFNAASTGSLSSSEDAFSVAKIFMTTNIAAAAAAFAAMMFSWFRYGKPDVSMSLNGALAGLVAITAGCAALEPWAALITGILAGVIVVLGIEFIEKVLKVDDPVGAVGVHGVCGAFGAIAVGLFSKENGLLTTGSWDQLAIQIIGILAIGAWVAVTMIIVFKVIKATIGLRVSTEEELAGLDSSEHDMASSYADFATSALAGDVTQYMSDRKNGDVKIDDAVPIIVEDNAGEGEGRLTKVEILTKQSMFEALKYEMNQIGVTGMTVTQVLGCGMQKGKMEYYRGVQLDNEMNLLPKIQVEIVIAKVPLKSVLEAARKVLYTGHIGDGKIFVYDVKTAMKMRTGEMGYDALQGVDE